jgi:hypothetical protein
LPTNAGSVVPNFTEPILPDFTESVLPDFIAMEITLPNGQEQTDTNHVININQDVFIPDGPNPILSEQHQFYDSNVNMALQQDSDLPGASTIMLTTTLIDEIENKMCFMVFKVMSTKSVLIVCQMRTVTCIKHQER